MSPSRSPLAATGKTARTDYESPAAGSPERSLNAPARSLPRGVRRAGRIALFGTLTAAMLPAFAVHEGVVRGEPARDAVRERWVRAWCAALLALFGVHVLSRGAPPPAGRGHLVVANHRSTADILVLLRTFGGHVVSRADLARWPLLGRAARAVGTVFVDRTDATSGAAALRVIRTLLARGQTVVVFAEGTTFADDEVRPFHAGAFVAAAQSGADVVPVGLAYATGSGAAFVGESFPAHLARMAGAPPSNVAMCIGEPLAAASGARARTLCDAARAQVQRLVIEARRLVDGPTERPSDGDPRTGLSS